MLNYFLFQFKLRCLNDSRQNINQFYAIVNMFFIIEVNNFTFLK